MLEFLKRKKAELIYDFEGRKGKIDLREDEIKIGREEEEVIGKFIEKEGDKIKIYPLRGFLTSMISRTQGLFIWDKGRKKYLFEDVSKNGSRINGRKTHRGEKIPLENKSRIDIQGVKFQILYK